MTEHTPGPWEADTLSMEDVAIVHSKITGDFRHIVWTGVMDDGKQRIAAMLGNSPAAAVNARLIAAAPDLLALLVESQEFVGGDWRARRDAAIAKVTGQ